jgi:hypothetical protein
VNRKTASGVPERGENYTRNKRQRDQEKRRKAKKAEEAARRAEGDTKKADADRLDESPAEQAGSPKQSNSKKKLVQTKYPEKYKHKKSHRRQRKAEEAPKKAEAERLLQRKLAEECPALEARNNKTLALQGE